MTFIRRKGKSSKQVETLFEEVLEELGLEEMPVMKCPIAYLSNRLRISFCLTKCWTPCNYFLTFEYILKDCEDSVCDRYAPCSACLEKIENHKTLYQVIKILFDNKKEVARAGGFSTRRNRKAKKSRKGREKARRIRRGEGK
jgi:hypothetical protein